MSSHVIFSKNAAAKRIVPPWSLYVRRGQIRAFPTVSYFYRDMFLKSALTEPTLHKARGGGILVYVKEKVTAYEETAAVDSWPIIEFVSQSLL